jgi:uncharacterized membrane protein
MPTTKQTDDTPPTTSEDGSRIVALTDGVIAIAITLLVLDIAVPEIPDAMVDEELGSALWGLREAVFGFVLSFWVIAYYWLGHRAVFSHLRRIDGTLIVINLVFLLVIAFSLAVACYSGVMAAAGLTLVAMIAYPRSQGHFRLDVSTDAVGWITRRTLVAPIIFTLAIPLAFLSGWLAIASWALIPITRGAMARRRN